MITTSIIEAGNMHNGTELGINWLWPKLSMSYMHCAGWAWLAIVISVLRIVNQVFYERIACQFRQVASHCKDSVAIMIFNQQCKLFRMCGWCGYGIPAIAIGPDEVATVAYYILGFVALPLLIVESAKLDNLLTHHGAAVVMSSLRIAHRINEAAAKEVAEGRSRSVEEAIEKFLAANFN